MRSNSCFSLGKDSFLLTLQRTRVKGLTTVLVVEEDDKKNEASKRLSRRRRKGHMCGSHEINKR